MLFKNIIINKKQKKVLSSVAFLWKDLRKKNFYYKNKIFTMEKR